MRWIHVIGLGAASVACRWGDPSPPEPTSRAHFHEWSALVDATWRGDRAEAARVAPLLTGGPPTDVPDGPAGAGDAQVAGALGFIPFADDPAELAEALLQAARGCGACHAALAVPPPEAPSHAPDRLVDRVVWARAGAADVDAASLIGGVGGDTP